MNYEQFLNEAKDSLEERLSEGYPGISIEITDVEKLQNHSYRGLSIREEGSNIGMSMDLDPFYGRLQDGEDKRFVMENLFREVSDRMDERPAFDVSRLQDYEKMRDP